MSFVNAACSCGNDKFVSTILQKIMLSRTTALRLVEIFHHEKCFLCEHVHLAQVIGDSSMARYDGHRVRKKDLRKESYTNVANIPHTSAVRIVPPAVVSLAEMVIPLL